MKLQNTTLGLNLFALLFAGVTACGEDSGTVNGSDNGSGNGTAVGPFPALEASPIFAVVNTDFQSTAISLLDGEASVIDGAWFTSGTTFPGLVAALSGDVMVVSGVGPDGAITVIDRFQTDVVTRVQPQSGDLIGQLRTQTDVDYSSNPQDVAFLSATRAFVSRYEPNPEPSEPSEAGTDLVGFDPSTMQRTDERVPLSQFDVTIDETFVPARPESIVEVNGQLVVGLSRLAFLPDFSVLGAPGQLAVVDAGLNVSGYALPSGLENCGAVRPVPGAADRVLVACRGNGSGDALANSSALVELAISTSTITIEHLWRPSDGPGRPAAVGSARPIASGRAVAVASGDFSAGTPDVLYDIDLAGGAATEVTRSAGPFELGGPAWDPSTGRLLVPDAVDGVEVYDESNGVFSAAGDGFVIDAASGLPPRSVVLLR